MSARGWLFYAPYATDPYQRGYFVRCAHTLGRQQRTVLLRARNAPGGMVMPADFLERRACHRLAARHPALLRTALGFPDAWMITDEGKAAWLKVKR